MHEATPVAGGAPAGRPLILHVFPSFAVGGAQMRFAAVANRWGDRWRHMIVAMDGVFTCRERLAPGLDVTFPDPGLVKGETGGNLRRIRAALAAWQPDVLVTSNWGSIEWALAQRLPLRRPIRHIHTEDGFGPEERERQLPRRVWTRRFALRGAQVMLPSRTLLRIATETWRLKPASLRYIPNGVDLARFAPAQDGAAPPWPGLPGSVGPVIGTVATLRPEKNLGRLLQAFRLVSNALPTQLGPAQLVIVGDGSERPKLEAQAAALGLAEAVLFAGHLPQPERAYRHFDLFAMSSDTEQMPLSILEAMAAARPVATTAVGDVRDMLAPENHPFVTALDPAPLAEACLSLLGDPALRARMGAANRAKAARDYEQERMFQTYAALFEGRPLPGEEPAHREAA